MNSGGAVVARVPRPIVERGSVLVRVHYSLISVGTEIAPLRSVAAARAGQHVDRARHRVREPGAALSPRVAARSAEGGGSRRADRAAPHGAASAARRRRAVTPAVARRRPDVDAGEPPRRVLHDRRRRHDARHRRHAGRLPDRCRRRSPCPTDQVPVVRVQGRVDDGAIAIGLLNDGARQLARLADLRAGPVRGHADLRSRRVARGDRRRHDGRRAGTIARDAVERRRRHGAADDRRAAAQRARHAGMGRRLFGRRRSRRRRRRHHRSRGRRSGRVRRRGPGEPRRLHHR